MGEGPLIHVVDDSAEIRDSVAILLESADFRVRSYESAEVFLKQVQGHRLEGCVVLDLCMPGMNGLDLHERLRTRGAGIPIVFLTGHGDVRTAVRAMRNGAFDFLEKPVDGHELILTIRRALEVDGERLRLERRLSALSDRERQVLELLVEGFSNGEIAFDLGISRRTVEKHRLRVMAKMEVDRLATLVRLVIADRRADTPSPGRGRDSR